MSHNPEQSSHPHDDQIDWSVVPQTIAEYAEFTGAPMHKTLHDDDPRRPGYHNQGFGFPQELPQASRSERRLLYKLSPNAFVEGEHGQSVLDAIMAATHDGKLDPNVNVFRQQVPQFAVVEHGEGGTITRTRVQVETTPHVDLNDSREVKWYGFTFADAIF